jgi:HPt (histidine-containing phosphotransfer) domain-containing protein
MHPSTHCPSEKPALGAAEMAQLRREFARSGGIGELVVMLKSEGPRSLVQIVTAIERGDADGLRRAAHALRGAAANFGAHPLEAWCDQIEICARQGRTAAAASLMDGLHAEFHRVLAALELESRQP